MEDLMWQNEITLHVELYVLCPLHAKLAQDSKFCLFLSLGLLNFWCFLKVNCM